MNSKLIIIISLISFSITCYGQSVSGFDLFNMNNEQKSEMVDSTSSNFYMISGGHATFHNNEIIKKIDTLDNVSADFDKDGLVDRAFVLKITKNNSYSGNMAEDVLIYIAKVILSNGKTLMSKEINLETRVIGLGYDKVANQIEIILKTDEFGFIESRFMKEFSVAFKYDKKSEDFIAVNASSYSLNLTIVCDYLHLTKSYSNTEGDNYNTLLRDKKTDDLIWLKKIHYTETIPPNILLLTNLTEAKLVENVNESEAFKKYVKKKAIDNGATL